MFKCHIRPKGERSFIEFDRGPTYDLPPKTEAEKDIILEQVAALKKPRCIHCGRRMIPRMRSSGQVYFHCTECNARETLRRSYVILSDEELASRLDKANESHERRVEVIHEIMVQRMERAK